jgi:hypothetical protein
VTTFFITRVLVKNIMVDAHNLSMRIKKNSRQAYNLRVIASVIQTIVLLAFADLGRFEGENHFIDANEILQRKTGFTLSSRNDDGMSQILFSPADFEEIFEVTWSTRMQDILRSWSERIASNCVG